MSFAGPAIFIAENIDAEELIYQMNGNNNGYEGYRKADTLKKRKGKG